MNVTQTLVETQELASPPTVVAKLLRLLEQEDVDVRAIAHLLEHDVAISAKVLRVANSPLFGLRQEVTSIPQAIMTIGLKRVTHIVLGVSIYSKLVYLQTLAGDFIERFWAHSAATATLARALALRFRQDFQELEFLAGLMHDIGKLALLQVDPERFRSALHQVESGQSELEAEAALFDLPHTEAGEIVARLWQFPEAVRHVIRWHHHPREAIANVPLVTLVRCADVLAEDFGFGIGEHQRIAEATCEAWDELTRHVRGEAVDLLSLRAEMSKHLDSAQALFAALTAGE